MSTITARLASRFSRWADRVVASDDRYICAVCDDRFHERSEGIEHMHRCHPQFSRVFILEGTESVQTAAKPGWTVSTAFA